MVRATHWGVCQTTTLTITGETKAICQMFDRGEGGGIGVLDRASKLWKTKVPTKQSCKTCSEAHLRQRCFQNCVFKISRQGGQQAGKSVQCMLVGFPLSFLIVRTRGFVPRCAPCLSLSDSLLRVYIEATLILAPTPREHDSWIVLPTAACFPHVFLNPMEKVKRM